MKILTVLSTFPPHFYGGGEVSALNLSRWLVQQGHEVGVVTAADRDEPELFGEMIEGMKVWRLRFPRPYTFWNHTKATKWQKPLWYLQDHFDPRNRKLMGVALDQFKPDLVNIQVATGIGYNSLRAIGARNIPAVYFLHDLNLACLWGSMFRDGQTCQTQCGKCKVISHFRFGDVASIRNLAFCSPSQSNLARAKSVLPLERYKTVAILNPNKYPTPTVPRSAADRVRLLYVGRMDKTKGVDFLLSVLDSLAGKYNFTIDLFGDGAERIPLQEQYKGKDWCRFRGHVPQTEISNAMMGSDALCVPSIWNEPLGDVAVHALSLGLPVLGSAVGGIPELVEHEKSGVLIAANDRSAWTNVLTSVFDRPEQLKVWGQYAQDNSGRFNQDTNGRKVVALFEEVIAGAKAA